MGLAGSLLNGANHRKRKNCGEMDPFPMMHLGELENGLDVYPDRHLCVLSPIFEIVLETVLLMGSVTAPYHSVKDERVISKGSLH